MVLVKRSIVFVLGFLVIHTTNAQHSFNPEKRKKQVVPVSLFTTNASALPFKNIIVKDVRFDTSKIGYSDDALAQRLVTKQPFEIELNESIKESIANKLDSNSRYNVYFFIRHFWVDCMPEKRIRQIFCKAQVEAFVESDSVFSPLFRFDSSFIIARQKTSLTAIVLFPFVSSIEKLNALTPESMIKNKKKLSLNDIVSNYTRPVTNPQITQPTLAKGVYMTYQDFLANRIVYPEFRYEQTLYTDDLFIKKNNEETILDDFWGFCDGDKQFMRLGHNFYQLVRQNRTFDLHGPSSIDLLRKKEGSANVPIGALPYGVMAFAVWSYDTSDRLVFKPMQLNLETGKPYGF